MRTAVRLTLPALLLGCAAELSAPTTPAPASLAFGELTSRFDGTPRYAPVVTDPVGIDGVLVLYRGTSGDFSTNPPTNTGSYEVVASLHNSKYAAAEIAGTFVVLPGNVPITHALSYRVSHSAFTEPARIIVRTDEEWVAVWETINNGGLRVRPVIDFEREMVLVAAMGQYQPANSVVWFQSGEMTESEEVFTVWYGYPTSCVTTGTVSSPADVIRIRKTDRPIRFVQAPNGDSCFFTP